MRKLRISRIRKQRGAFGVALACGGRHVLKTCCSWTLAARHSRASRLPQCRAETCVLSQTRMRLRILARAFSTLFFPRAACVLLLRMLTSHASVLFWPGMAGQVQGFLRASWHVPRFLLLSD